MSLKDRINDDMKAAMRARETERLGTIRLLLAAIKQREVDERIMLDDAAITAVIDKMIKQRKDSISQFEAAGRTDLVEKESAELTILVGLYAGADVGRGNRRRSAGGGRANRRRRPAGHGQGDGRAQAEARGPCRYDRRVRAGQGCAREIIARFPVCAAHSWTGWPRSLQAFKVAPPL